MWRDGEAERTRSAPGIAHLVPGSRMTGMLISASLCSPLTKSARMKRADEDCAEWSSWVMGSRHMTGRLGPREEPGDTQDGSDPSGRPGFCAVPCAELTPLDGDVAVIGMPYTTPGPP